MKVNGKYPTPSASNLAQTALHVLAEDLIDTIHGLPLEFKRATLKSRSKIKARDDFDLSTLVDDDKEMLHFIIECIRCWLPPSGDCFGVPLPFTVSWPLAAHRILWLHAMYPHTHIIGRCCF